MLLLLLCFCRFVRLDFLLVVRFGDIYATVAATHTKCEIVCELVFDVTRVWEVVLVSVLGVYDYQY